MRTHQFVTSSLCAIAIAAFGCSKKEGGEPAAKTEPAKTATGAVEPAKTEPAAPAVAPAPAAGKGTIKGKVILEGAVPPMPELPRQSDPVCAKTKMNANYVEAGPDGALKNVVVRLPNGAAKGDKPATPVVINQSNCMYEPYVAVAMTGQQIQIKNSDKTTHNIHTYVGDETIFNEAQPPGAPDLQKDLEAQGGSVMKLTCDVHKWMEAFVVVTDHPFAAVTGADGTFEIKDAPAGTYKLEAWHPNLGAVKTAEVTVKDGETAQVEFKFAAADYKRP